MELLINGSKAFPEIIKSIQSARDSIEINMFIWRNDAIGNCIAEELLDAANRGVNVTISKDRYGVICESCEENRLSFFHRKPSLREKVKIQTLSLLYNRDAKTPGRPAQTDSGELLSALQNHPNVTITTHYKYDHSKFFLFDRKVLILGGINIEDKENGFDYSGRRYQDYMVKIVEPELIDEFLSRRKAPGPKSGSFFEMNRKEPRRWFGMKDAYLRLIDSAEEKLTIVMAYFSPLPEFEAAILQASERGVAVQVLIPAQANFQDDLNKKTVTRLLKRSGRKIQVSVYPGMLHTKLLMSEKTITLGSCNITKKAFGQLDELNLFVPNNDTPFSAAVRESVAQTLEESAVLTLPASYHPVKAAMESLLV